MEKLEGAMRAAFRRVGVTGEGGVGSIDTPSTLFPSLDESYAQIATLLREQEALRDSSSGTEARPEPLAVPQVPVATGAPAEAPKRTIVAETERHQPKSFEELVERLKKAGFKDLVPAVTEVAKVCGKIDAATQVIESSDPATRGVLDLVRKQYADEGSKGHLYDFIEHTITGKEAKNVQADAKCLIDQALERNRAAFRVLKAKIKEGEETKKSGVGFLGLRREGKVNGAPEELPKKAPVGTPQVATEDKDAGTPSAPEAVVNSQEERMPVVPENSPPEGAGRPTAHSPEEFKSVLNTVDISEVNLGYLDRLIETIRKFGGEVTTPAHGVVETSAIVSHLEALRDIAVGARPFERDAFTVLLNELNASLPTGYVRRVSGIVKKCVDDIQNFVPPSSTRKKPVATPEPEKPTPEEKLPTVAATADAGSEKGGPATPPSLTETSDLGANAGPVPKDKYGLHTSYEWKGNKVPDTWFTHAPNTVFDSKKPVATPEPEESTPEEKLANVTATTDVGSEMGGVMTPEVQPQPSTAIDSEWKAAREGYRTFTKELNNARSSYLAKLNDYESLRREGGMFRWMFSSSKLKEARAAVEEEKKKYNTLLDRIHSERTTYLRAFKYDFLTRKKGVETSEAEKKAAAKRAKVIQLHAAVLDKRIDEDVKLIEAVRIDQNANGESNSRLVRLWQMYSKAKWYNKVLLGAGVVGLGGVAFSAAAGVGIAASAGTGAFLAGRRVVAGSAGVGAAMGVKLLGDRMAEQYGERKLKVLKDAAKRETWETRSLAEELEARLGVNQGVRIRKRVATATAAGAAIAAGAGASGAYAAAVEGAMLPADVPSEGTPPSSNTAPGATSPEKTPSVAPVDSNELTSADEVVRKRTTEIPGTPAQLAATPPEGSSNVPPSEDFTTEDDAFRQYLCDSLDASLGRVPETNGVANDLPESSVKGSVAPLNASVDPISAPGVDVAVPKEAVSNVSPAVSMNPAPEVHTVVEPQAPSQVPDTPATAKPTVDQAPTMAEAMRASWQNSELNARNDEVLADARGRGAAVEPNPEPEPSVAPVQKPAPLTPREYMRALTPEHFHDPHAERVTISGVYEKTEIVQGGEPIKKTASVQGELIKHLQGTWSGLTEGEAGKVAHQLQKEMENFTGDPALAQEFKTKFGVKEDWNVVPINGSYNIELPKDMVESFVARFRPDLIGTDTQTPSSAVATTLERAPTTEPLRVIDQAPASSSKPPTQMTPEQMRAQAAAETAASAQNQVPQSEVPTISPPEVVPDATSVSESQNQLEALQQQEASVREQLAVAQQELEELRKEREMMRARFDALEGRRVVDPEAPPVTGVDTVRLGAWPEAQLKSALDSMREATRVIDTQIGDAWNEGMYLPESAHDAWKKVFGSCNAFTDLPRVHQSAVIDAWKSLGYVDVAKLYDTTEGQTYTLPSSGGNSAQVSLSNETEAFMRSVLSELEMQYGERVKELVDSAQTTEGVTMTSLFNDINQVIQGAPDRF